MPAQPGALVHVCLPCLCTQFLYACGKYEDHHDAGEAAHWPPFQAAAVRYLVGLQPDPLQWDADQRQLAAFTFGLAAHYVADELWEGLTAQLGSKRGFTEMVDAFQLGRLSTRCTLNFRTLVLGTYSVLDTQLGGRGE